VALIANDPIIHGIDRSARRHTATISLLLYVLLTCAVVEPVLVLATTVFIFVFVVVTIVMHFDPGFVCGSMPRSWSMRRTGSRTGTMLVLVRISMRRHAYQNRERRDAGKHTMKLGETYEKHANFLDAL
jgi:hypothetical protein